MESKAKFYFFFAIMNFQDQPFTVAKRYKTNLLLYHLVEFGGTEEERESEKKINKNMSNIYCIVNCVLK